MAVIRKYQYRFLARVVIEAAAPLNIGSGNKGIKSDSLVVRDVNGLPFIPGTTLAGLLRHSLPQEEQEVLMGSRSCGSSLVITEAKIVDADGTPVDGIAPSEILDSEFLSRYKELPIRQHVKIGHRGATVRHGKFDEEIVLKGTRFCFEIEFVADNKSQESQIKKLLSCLLSDTFRIGSGSRSGFGQIDVVSCKYQMVDLTNEKELALYLKKSSSLSQEWEGFTDDILEELKALKPASDGWVEYQLRLTPEDFFFFGSGYGNDTADMTFVRESYVDWNGNVATMIEKEQVLLIPASSVKGALSHRLAFHYNKLVGNTVESLQEKGLAPEDFTGKNNPAVKALFGSEGEKSERGGELIGKQRGNVLVSDVMETRFIQPKLLNHVSIDRFTGGAIDGALFTEQVVYGGRQELPVMTLFVRSDALKDDIILKAWESALEDLCKGMLPLGGGSNRGHGVFKGSLTKNGQLLYGE